MKTRLGFTAVELVAALALAGVLLLTARLAVVTVADSRAAISARSARLQRDGAGVRTLRELLLMAQATEAGARPFFGDSTSATFRTRCRSAGGWVEPCEAAIQVVRHGARSIVQARLGERPWLELVRFDGQVRFEYLEVRDTLVTWRSHWGESITRPQAVALRSAQSVNVFRTGAP